MFLGESVKRFNPETGEHEEVASEKVEYSCLVNFMSKGKQFEEYGTRENEIIIVRFNSQVPHFDKAIYNSNTYRLVEETQVDKKGAYRLQRVVE